MTGHLLSPRMMELLEKAADALGSLGVVATTSHAGAGGWNEELNQYFKDANVVIVPDNDLVGWSYAQKVE